MNHIKEMKYAKKQNELLKSISKFYMKNYSRKELKQIFKGESK
jgi:hypothetical protein